MYRWNNAHSWKDLNTKNYNNSYKKNKSDKEKNDLEGETIPLRGNRKKIKRKKKGFAEKLFSAPKNQNQTLE